MQSILWAAVGTGFTFLMTATGAAMVFLFRARLNAAVQRIFLGFAAGVMIAASVWSLLIPAIEEAEAAGTLGFVADKAAGKPKDLWTDLCLAAGDFGRIPADGSGAAER